MGGWGAKPKAEILFSWRVSSTIRLVVLVLFEDSPNGIKNLEREKLLFQSKNDKKHTKDVAFLSNNRKRIFVHTTLLWCILRGPRDHCCTETKKADGKDVWLHSRDASDHPSRSSPHRMGYKNQSAQKTRKSLCWWKKQHEMWKKKNIVYAFHVAKCGQQKMLRTRHTNEYLRLI